MPYLDLITVPAGLFAPDWTAPTSDAVAEQSVACTFGNEPTILQWSATITPLDWWQDPPWTAIPPTDTIAEQSVARTFGNDPTILQWSDTIMPLDWLQDPSWAQVLGLPDQQDPVTATAPLHLMRYRQKGAAMIHP